MTVTRGVVYLLTTTVLLLLFRLHSQSRRRGDAWVSEDVHHAFKWDPVGGLDPYSPFGQGLNGPP